MERRDGPIRLPILEPRLPAGIRPRRARHERRDVLKVIVHGCGRGRNGFDAFRLTLLDDARDVLGDVF
jgi:hypothetical protein